MTPAEKARGEQLQGSNPAVSAFVEASAGSGKTKLLTDRILRLMLGGTAPGRIQCLTFTKAAAAEMSVRLQTRLGKWVTLDDGKLDSELDGLEVRRSVETRQAARSLFAQVLDLPGGMRISTIHAFCQSLLRRFPLEAAISPQFRLIEGVDATVTLDRAREGVIASADPAALTGLAPLASLADVAKLVRELQAFSGRVEGLSALSERALRVGVRRLLDVRWPDRATLMEDAVEPPDEPALAEAVRQVAAHGSDSAQKFADPMLAWLGMAAPGRAADWSSWVAALRTQEGKPRQISAFADKPLRKRHPGIQDLIEAEQARVFALDDQRRGLEASEATLALLAVTLPVLRAYQSAKTYAGQVDYADLIARTSQLLVDPGAAWVLYKLDGGIDHLLLDEVQDTAPAQWQIAHRLTEEFFAGLGTRGDGPPRTFFAVGDPKQSIYSFQGAEPDEFSRSRNEMKRRVTDSKTVWRDVTLDVSFRSAAPVLALVDAVFDNPVARAGVADDAQLKHFAHRTGQAGRVELWPLVPATPAVVANLWEPAERNTAAPDASMRLADALACWIARQIAAEVPLQSRGRPVQPGDYLILVRRRTDFNAALVSGLKTRGVPVAGLDEIKLLEQLAVLDLLALMDAVLLPEDDLAVACVLTSPLGGLSDASLMDLSLPGGQFRSHSLWNTLRTRHAERPEWDRAWQFLRTVQSRADHVTPHALLAEALGRLGGRARLLDRLGPDAAEPIDELLSAALTHAQSNAPSLQGFLHWVRQSAAAVKREAGGAGGLVRIMTVHGAKGLEAPIVILPDTAGLPPHAGNLTWVHDAPSGTDLPLWRPRKELRCAALDAHRDAARQAAMREHNRLLYVALTRAEDRLVVCGWAGRGELKPESWYRLVEDAFSRLDTTEEGFALGWDGPVLVHAAPQTAAPKAEATAADGIASALPSWAGTPGAWVAAAPPPEPALPVPLAPSRPDGAAFGPVPRAASPLVGGTALYQRGRLVHALLQHLPALPPHAWPGAMAAYLARHDLTPGEQARLVQQVTAVLTHPDLATAYAPGSRAEQPLTGIVGGAVVTGIVDRLAVGADAVWVVDYKTGRAAPPDVADTPVRYLRQLAAYRGVLRGIYPGRTVRAVLVWTDQAQVVTIPDALLDTVDPMPGPTHVTAVIGEMA